MSSDLEEVMDFSCGFCPLVIKPIENVLVEAIVRRQNSPECFSRELIVLAELLGIGTVENFAAGHMARTTGAVYSFMLFYGFSEQISDYAFWAVPGHDNGKVTKEFYMNIAWDGRPIKGLDSSLEKPASKVFDKTKIAPILFKHIKYAPYIIRVLHNLFKWPIDEIFDLSLVVSPLHHLIGSQMPTIEYIEGRPHISEFEYLVSTAERDRDLIEGTAKAVFELSREISTMEQLIEVSPQSRHNLLAAIVMISTLMDIVDALHRRPYLLKQDPKPEEIEAVLNRSILPKFLIKAGMTWYRSFGSTSDYYDHTLKVGWEKLAVPLLSAHSKTHRPDEDCELAKMINRSVLKINPEAHIYKWAQNIVIPNLHYRSV